MIELAEHINILQGTGELYINLVLFLRYRVTMHRGKDTKNSQSFKGFNL